MLSALLHRTVSWVLYQHHLGIPDTIIKTEVNSSLTLSFSNQSWPQASCIKARKQQSSKDHPVQVSEERRYIKETNYFKMILVSCGIKYCQQTKETANTHGKTRFIRQPSFIKQFAEQQQKSITTASCICQTSSINKRKLSSPVHTLLVPRGPAKNVESPPEHIFPHDVITITCKSCSPNVYLDNDTEKCIIFICIKPVKKKKKVVL